jgi:hypothetical protein
LQVGHAFCILLKAAAHWIVAQLAPRAMSIGDFPMRRIREWGPPPRLPPFGAEGAWPLPYFSNHFNRKLETQLNVFSLSLVHGLPPCVYSGGRLQPLVGPDFFIYHRIIIFFTLVDCYITSPSFPMIQVYPSKLVKVDYYVLYFQPISDLS